MIKYWFIFSSIVLFSQLSMASSTHEGDTNASKYYFVTGLRFHYGFIVTHTREIADISESNPLSVQMDFGWHLNTKKAFNQCNCYPRIGLSLSYWDFQNPNILGKGGFAIFFLEPFFGISRRVLFSIRPGVGMAYLSKPYDPVYNPLNLSYSTHLAFALYLNTTLYFNLNSQFALNVAFNINHISNGGVKLPNKGLNFPSLSLGLDYSIKPRNFTDFDKGKPELLNRDQWFFICMFLGFKSTVFDDNTHYIFGAEGKYTMQIGYHSAISGGLELMYDDARRKLVDQFKSMNKNAPYIGSVNTGYEHILGKFRLTFDLGLYFYHMDRDDLLYQRYGIKYQVYKSMFFGLNLKAHRQQAEFFDIRLGFQL